MVYKQTQGKEEYQSFLPQIAELDSRITWEEDAQIIRILMPISDTLELQVALKALYPQQVGDPYLEILSWKSAVTGEWTPDKKQPVYKGDKK